MSGESRQGDILYQIPREALMWVLTAVVLVILPQVLNVPMWVLAIALACVVLRILIHTGRINYPDRRLRAVLVTVTLMLAVVQLRDLGVGLESATALLTLGFVFKLIEMQYKRDIYVVISLCYVMALVAFIYSQSALTTAYISLVLFVTAIAMVALNRSAGVKDAGGTPRLALKISLQAVPLMVVLFLIFPRLAPLWAVPMPSGGTTGVSDEMTPGDISSLGRSAELAFRVKFENSLPPLHESLYWRGLVLDEFDGQTWSRSGRNFYGGRGSAIGPDWEGRSERGGVALEYDVILEPTRQEWLFGLHLAERVSGNVSQTINFELFNSELVTQRFGYRLRTYPRYRTDIMLLDRLRRRNLEIPEAGNDRARQFATDLRASVNTDREFARAVLAHFQQEEFYYTLNPPLLGDNSVDEFLFSTRQGFCEHYASSFTYLMRSVGIPARVVVGYQGAEYNRFEDYLMVYQYNAHAWSEVWLEGEGWIRFDPTGAVSPERITLGVEAVLQNQPGFLSESFFSRYRSMSWLNTLRLRMDALEYEWNRRVVSYNDERQMQLLQSILGDATERRILILLVALVGVVVLVLAFSIIRFNGRRLDPVTRLYFAFCDDLRRAGMPRNKGEGPLDFCRRIELSRPDLAERAHAFTRLYMQLQYESIPQDPKGRQNREAHRQLRKLLMRSRLGMVPFLR